ncbi:hypothetical protein [Gordonia amicalis]|uniref:hypothetical protein n=1 Tax=Gordonia amicalis TaxID=89053 RepID=UPI0015F66145|nr:hypothetical protein [Gordonia amicalis]MBA5845968.1 hypothetical protein [Gordonia amicalis]UOG21217.1 hypothetical protein MTX80_19955 [Gordonia amicalis]
MGQPYDPGSSGAPNPYQPGPNQPGPYGYGGYPPPAPPKDRTGMRLWGKILTAVGVVILVASVAVGVVLAVSGISQVVDQADQAFVVDPRAEHRYDAGDTFALFRPDNTAATPSCEITGPAALERGTDVTAEFPYDGTQVRSFDSYKVVEAGTYSFLCSGRVVVATIDLGGIFSGVGGVLLAVLGGGFGAVLLLIGIVLWAIAGRRPRTA